MPSQHLLLLDISTCCTGNFVDSRFEWPPLFISFPEKPNVKSTNLSLYNDLIFVGIDNLIVSNAKVFFSAQEVNLLSFLWTLLFLLSCDAVHHYWNSMEILIRIPKKTRFLFAKKVISLRFQLVSTRRNWLTLFAQVIIIKKSDVNPSWDFSVATE